MSRSGGPTRTIDRGRLGVALERRRFRLRVERGPSKQELTSSAERVVAGSHEGADLVIADPSVSRMHFEIVADPAGYLLRDLDSTNGTEVGGLRVVEAYLPERARIVAGSTEISFALLPDVDEIPLHPSGRFGALIGDSPAMRALFERLNRVAPRDTTVLIEGESGTGKELAARALHEASPRRDRPFVVVDCASIPRTLLESELFGHERGAYTGANQSRPGAFQRASGGTLFLDEIGELDIDLQPRLLGALERREVKPVGGAPVAIDVRIVAATNRDMEREVNRGTLREDLYYRLAVVRVIMPPLRQRASDVSALVRHFLDEHSARDGTRYTIDSTTLEALAVRRWPGNVRELRNVVEQIVALGADEVVSVPASSGAPGGEEAGSPDSGVNLDSAFRDGKAAVTERFEREYLCGMLARHGGNITAAAHAADVDRVHFVRMLDRYGLRRRAP